MPADLFRVIATFHDADGNPLVGKMIDGNSIASAWRGAIRNGLESIRRYRMSSAAVLRQWLRVINQLFGIGLKGECGNISPGNAIVGIV